MSKLKTKQVTHLEVDYNDLEELIKATYKRPDYNIVAAEEWSNDSSHEVSAKPDEPDDYEQEELAEFKALTNKYSPSLYVLMDDMCRQGLIEPGDYIVQVCW